MSLHDVPIHPLVGILGGSRGYVPAQRPAAEPPAPKSEAPQDAPKRRRFRRR